MSRPSSIKVHHKAYQELIQVYQTYLLRLGYTPKSAVGAARYVSALLAWLERQNSSDLQMVEAKHLNSYQRYLQNRPNQNKDGKLSSKSVYTHLKAVQQFFAYLLDQECITVDPSSHLKISYPRKVSPRNILSVEQIQTLYASCESKCERALLSLVYGCGLRAAELEQLNVDRVLLREGLLIVASGKGNKRRVIPMSTGVVSDLINYYQDERPHLIRTPQTAFMLHSRGERMRAYTANKYLQNILVSAVEKGLLGATVLKQNISLHSLRHSIATHLIEQGVSVEQVRQFLGHSQLETTQIYTHVSAEQLEKLIP
jgi:integrase/recombinase XerD